MEATICAFSAIWWEAPLSSSMVAVVSWMAEAWALVEDSFWVAAASTSADEVESWSAASRISVTNFFSVSITWPMPAMSGVSAASRTPSRRRAGQVALDDQADHRPRWPRPRRW